MTWLSQKCSRPLSFIQKPWRATCGLKIFFMCETEWILHVPWYLAVISFFHVENILFYFPCEFFFLVKNVFVSREIFFFSWKLFFFLVKNVFFFSWIFFSCKKNIFFLVKNVFVERIFLNKKFLLISKWYIYILYKFLGVEKTWKNAEKTEKQNVKKKKILKKFTSSNWVKLVCKFLCRTKWNIFPLQEKMYDFCVEQKCREKPNVKKKLWKKILEKNKFTYRKRNHSSLKKFFHWFHTWKK